MIGIIVAMTVEADGIKTLMSDKKDTTISDIVFTQGTIYGRDTVVAVCGIGKVFAALCAQTMILHFSASVIFNVGVGGALSPKLHIGEIVIAEKLVQHDLDTSALGDPLGWISGINIVYLPCSERLTAIIAECTEKLGLRATKGTIATGDRFVSQHAQKSRIVDTFAAIACDMEGASIAQVCYVNHVEFACIRAISDGADDDSQMEYEQFKEMAAANSCAVVRLLLQQL